MTIRALKYEFTLRVHADDQYRDWALRKLYRRQTLSEQAHGITQVRNGAGFTAPDAGVLTALAKQVIAGKPLTASEELVIQRRLCKYWRQFVRLAEPPETEVPKKPADGAAASAESMSEKEIVA
jgi:hypothetical protein